MSLFKIDFLILNELFKRNEFIVGFVLFLIMIVLYFCFLFFCNFLVVDIFCGDLYFCFFFFGLWVFFFFEDLNKSCLM